VNKVVCVSTAHSRVKIYDLWANLKKNCKKTFYDIFCIIGSWEQHIKSWTKWGHHKWPKFDVKNIWPPLFKKWSVFSSVRSTDLVLPIYLTKNAVKLIRQCIHHSEVLARTYKWQDDKGLATPLEQWSDTWRDRLTLAVGNVVWPLWTAAALLQCRLCQQKLSSTFASGSDTRPRLSLLVFSPHLTATSDLYAT